MTRYPRLALAGLLLMTSLMAPVAAGQSEPSQGRTPAGAQAEGDETVFLPAVFNRFDSGLRIPLFGVQMYNVSGPGNDYYNQMVESGTSWVRVPLYWTWIEPTDVSPDHYVWGLADATLEGALEPGINLVVTVRDAPSWAAEYPNGPITVTNYIDFEEFIGELVERYDGDGLHDAPGSPVVDHWEFYNEPDRTDGDWVEGMCFWGHYGEDYALMLSHAYSAAKGASQDAKVVFGGIAYDYFEPNGPFAPEFLDDVLEAGGGQHFDIMNYHVYPAFRKVWAPQGPGLLQKGEAIRSKLLDHGVDKPLISTEAGWFSAKRDPGNPGSSEETQARYVAELFTQSMAGDLQIMIWWMLYEPNSPWDLYGLVDYDGDPKPSYTAFQTIASELGTAHFERVLSLSETGSSDMEAYQFIDLVHNRRVYVAWLDPIDSTDVQPLRLVASKVTVRDIYGTSYTLKDGDDGASDGWVTVPVGGQPVYVEKNL